MRGREPEEKKKVRYISLKPVCMCTHTDKFHVHCPFLTNKQRLHLVYGQCAQL